MATVLNDQIDDLNLVEDNGTIVSLRRKAKITGLTNTNNDAQTLDEALTALDGAGLTAGSAPTGYANLLLTKRSVKIIPGNTDKAEALLDYVPLAQSGRFFHWFGSSNLGNLTRETDRFGTPISVSHTYAAGDLAGRGGYTDTQGGEANVRQQNFQLTGVGIATSNNPIISQSQWLMYTNSRSWWGVNAGFWLCTGVDFEPLDVTLTPNRFRWTFKFELTPTRVQPRVYYIDPLTNRTPPDLVEGTGMKNIEWYPQRDFNTVFPT